MITNEKANELLQELKKRVLAAIFVWESNRSQNELIVSVNDDKRHFILSLKRNPFEIRLHLRTKDKDIGLARIDNAAYHLNPDGTEIRGPHLHYYVEGFDLAYAKLIDWHNINSPTDTLHKFLEHINTEKFPVQLEMF